MAKRVMIKHFNALHTDYVFIECVICTESLITFSRGTSLDTLIDTPTNFLSSLICAICNSRPSFNTSYKRWKKRY